MHRTIIGALALALTVSAAGCSDDDASSSKPTPTSFVFHPAADPEAEGMFFATPWPSDARLTENGTPDMRGYPKPEAAVILDGLVDEAGERHGWPTIPVAYFQFTGALGDLDLDEVIAADAASPILLVDVDDDGGERGRLIPTVARVLEEDSYVSGTVLAVAARPGFVLEPDRTYAVIVMRELADATGAPLDPGGFAELLPGGEPSPEVASLAPMYEPVWSTLDDLGVDSAAVAAATVFTTGDVVRETYELSEGLREKHAVTIDDLALDPDDGADHERYCELHGVVRYPQFQTGEPPFDTDGTFELGDDGLPVVQREEEAPIVVTVPKGEMPEGGYPLTVYFHGSGGLAAQVVDRGTVTVPEGQPIKGEGPSHVLAAHGFATAGSAMPVNPERLPGATDIAYINFNNPRAFPGTFRQGVIEQRLFIDALLELSLDPALLDGCDGPTLPAGETAFRFAESRLTAMGQSMGGMYTNMIGATEPRIKAVVPTGAGGYWGYFILETQLVPGAGALLAILVDTKVELSFVHPALSLLSMAWEPAEPMVYMPRLAKNPLEGHEPRPTYQPVGKGDTFFPIQIFDAMTLAYGHQQAGDEVWPTLQEALALDDLDGILPYPITDNRESDDGVPYTGLVVQYEGDGIYDPHAIAFQLDDVKYQYSCFLRGFVETGVGTVPAPASLSTPCP